MYLGPATTACAPSSSARRELPSDSPRIPSARHAAEEGRTLLCWTGASWGKAAALSLDRPEFAGDFPIVHALVRAPELDESWNFGAIHVAMISLEGCRRAWAATAIVPRGITNARWR